MSRGITPVAAANATGGAVGGGGPEASWVPWAHLLVAEESSASGYFFQGPKHGIVRWGGDIHSLTNSKMPGCVRWIEKKRRSRQRRFSPTNG